MLYADTCNICGGHKPHFYGGFSPSGTLPPTDTKQSILKEFKNGLKGFTNIEVVGLNKTELDKLNKAFEIVLKEVHRDGGNTSMLEFLQKNPELILEQANIFASAVRSGYNNVTVQADWTTPDKRMLDNLTNNVWHFSAAKSYLEAKEMSSLLIGKDGKLRNWNDFKNAVDESNFKGKYIGAWLQTEYNAAVATSTSAARWTDFMENADVMPNLQYQTVGDDYVRDEHARLDGVVRPIEDSFWDMYYPPNGWNCRCEALQIPTGYGPVTPKENLPAILVPDLFKQNLAKTGTIFPKEHPYYKAIPKGDRNGLEELAKHLKNNQPLDINQIKKYENGGSFSQFEIIDTQKSDWRAVKEIGLAFAKKGKTVIATPIINVKSENYDKVYGALKGTKYYGKNPDLKINNLFYEVEGFDKTKDLTSQQKIKDTFSAMLTKGLKQSDRIIIEDCGISNIQAYRMIWNRVNNEKQQISEIWVKRNNGKLEILYKKEPD